jgi:hypothetical protein
MFFAPVVAPPPPMPPAHVEVVRAARNLPRGPSFGVPDLDKSVSVPASYRYGACQAVNYVAWSIGWSFSGDCAPYNLKNYTQPLQLPFGQSARAADWLSALAHALPVGVVTRIDPDSKTISVSPQQ